MERERKRKKKCEKQEEEREEQERRARFKLYFGGCAVLGAVLGACTAPCLSQHLNLQMDRYRYLLSTWGRWCAVKKKMEEKRNKEDH